jgi:hypothetical protein
MGVLRARVGGQWVDIGSGVPSAGGVYGIAMYHSLLASTTSVSNVRTTLVTIPMPASPVGTLLDISWMVYENQTAVGTTGTIYIAQVNGVDQSR